MAARKLKPAPRPNVKLGQIYSHKPRRGFRQYYKVVSVRGKFQRLVRVRINGMDGSRIYTHRPPANAFVISVTSGGASKRGRYTDAAGWRMAFSTLDNPRPVLLEPACGGRVWMMPTVYRLENL